MIELLVVLSLVAIMLQLFVRIYFNHQGIERYVFYNYQAIVNLKKLSTSLKQYFKLASESRAWMASKQSCNDDFSDLIGSLKQGFKVENAQIHLYYLSRKNALIERVAGNQHQCYVGGSGFKPGGYVFIFNANKFQVLHIIDVFDNLNEQRLTLSGDINLKGELHLRQINKVSFINAQKGIILKKNHLHQLLYANDITFHHIAFIRCDGGSCRLQQSENDGMAGLVVKWVFSAKQFTRSMNQWLV